MRDVESNAAEMRRFRFKALERVELLRLAMRHRPAESFQRFGADMVLDAFGVDARRLGADAKRAQEGLHRLVADTAFLGDLAASLGQEHAAIGFSRHQPVGAEPGQHLRHRRLRHAKPRGDINLSRFVAVLDQVGDELDIVLDQRAAARFTRLPESFRMDLGIGKRLFASNRFVPKRQYALLLA
ncbi:hypothetical protein MPL1032_130012 [Mesorhizobium plurifarium]|uniref:Uncharacterized protein n=1 Tax=Mesorhizobium plurifarium TaxID=69974 RepID=A0A0K2VQU5_MESPL|nr:hypothetical protein MPL1032_130012 [Mesorhizobium plurifarium]